MKKKTKRGVSLAELIIAVSVLVIAGTGLFIAFAAGLQQSTNAHIITMAGIEAQLQVEQLLGRPWTGDLQHINWGGNRIPSNGFYICLSRPNPSFPSTCAFAEPNPRVLGVIIRVYADNDPLNTNYLIEHSHILDVYGF